MKPFRRLIDFEAVLVIESLPKAVQRGFRAPLREISIAPALHSDFAEYDSDGRPVQINISGAFAIKFWVDHADRQVKVLDVHRADRSR